MKTTKLDSITVFNIAETAARVLWEERPGQTDPCEGLIADNVRSNLRIMARRSAIATLRWLWTTGDCEQRITVAARVRVWLKRPMGNASLSWRIIEVRENARSHDGSIPKSFTNELRDLRTHIAVAAVMKEAA